MKRFVLSTFLVSFGALIRVCGSLIRSLIAQLKPRVMCKSLDEVNTMVDQGNSYWYRPLAYPA